MVYIVRIETTAVRGCNATTTSPGSSVLANVRIVSVWEARKPDPRRQQTGVMSTLVTGITLIRKDTLRCALQCVSECKSETQQNSGNVQNPNRKVNVRLRRASSSQRPSRCVRLRAQQRHQLERTHFHALCSVSEYNTSQRAFKNDPPKKGGMVSTNAPGTSIPFSSHIRRANLVFCSSSS